MSPSRPPASFTSVGAQSTCPVVSAVVVKTGLIRIHLVGYWQFLHFGSYSLPFAIVSDPALAGVQSLTLPPALLFPASARRRPRPLDHYRPLLHLVHYYAPLLV